MAKQKKSKEQSPLRIIPLGGLGEVGKNSWVFATEDNWIVIDAGLGFPFNEYPGIELIFPSLDYLIENKDKVKALIITHSHEDHIGGAIRTLTNVDIPAVYSSKLTNALLEKKCEDLGLKLKAKFKTVNPHDEITIGSIKIEFLRTTHSVPDCFALLIKTEHGDILLTGDFKFDFTPVDGEHFDIPGFVEAGNKGIKLLISDSTNVERSGFSLSEKTVGPNLVKLFEKTPKRIFITSFSSHIHRIQQIVDAAKQTSRKVCFYGYSIEIFCQIAKETGYLNYDKETVLTIDEILELPEDKIVIITSGSQGEHTSTLVKMARKEHKTLQIIPGDTIIFSANPIPGNERAVSKLQDQLSVLGANLVYGRAQNIHVSGHASQEELKLMLALTRPEHFLPAHGDYRMLVQHAELAANMGINPEKIYILQNGDVLELLNDEFNIIKNEIEASAVYYDAISGGIVDERNLKDRSTMGQEGLILLSFSLEKDMDSIKSLEFDFKGVSFKDDVSLDDLINDIKKQIDQAYQRMKKFGTLDVNNLRMVSKDLTFKITDNKLHCKPLILVMINKSDNK